MRVTKSNISLELECWVEELSPAQLAAFEKVANEHNAIKNALKTAISVNDGKELFTGQVFQAYSFKGKVLQEFKEATLPPKKPVKANETLSATNRNRKRQSNYVYLESSSDENEDDVPLAKRMTTAGKRGAASTPTPAKAAQGKRGAEADKGGKSAGKSKAAAAAAPTPPPPVRPTENNAVGGLVVGLDGKDSSKENKETKLQGKTFPSLVVLAKPWLKVKDMSATRSKLDSKVKLVLMLTPNKFTEWLIQEGLLKAEQRCSNHRNNELKLGVYSDATKFPFSGGYVWVSECCPNRFVSVFHGSIFEGAPHPPSCILKLIYHWSCQTNIQNVVQWVKVDNVYIKGVYTWLRAVCTLAVHQKCQKLGGSEKFVEVGVISLGTTSQDGQQRQVKVEVLGVLDHSERTIRLRAVEPLADGDRNYKKRFQTILDPLSRWVHKDSIICIDLTIDKITLHSMGFKNIIQASPTDSTAKHTNSAVMDYLRRIVPRMFQNTLSLLSRQMIQQFLDELVWRENFGTYALQAFNNITSHIAEQTRMTTNETLTQRLYQVATNPFKDWSALPANYKEIPVNTTPKRLKKPINDADYAPAGKVSVKKEKDTPSTSVGSRRRGAPPPDDDDYKPTSEKKSKASLSASSTKGSAASAKGSAAAKGGAVGKNATPGKSAGQAKGGASSKSTPAKGASGPSKKPGPAIDPKNIKKEKEEDDLQGLEEMYYGVRNGLEINFESFPYTEKPDLPVAKTVDCPICDINESYDSNEKLQTHLVSHITINGKDHQFQCLFCLEKHPSESVLAKHSQMMHPTETKLDSSPSYHCLICQQRFNSLHVLTVHLQKMHNMLELPYHCQACNYRTSLHRDLVRHFYDDHKNQNFLQCPFCLDIFRFCYKGQINISNIENYYMHLRQHVSKKDPQLSCQKCALSFVDKGAFKQHYINHHNSFVKSSHEIQPLVKNSMLINPPKIRTHHREPVPYTIRHKLGDFFAFIDGRFCAECNSEILNEDHFPAMMKCNKCNYRTSCERAMFEHTTDCNGIAAVARDLMELPLPNEMHCICGYSTAIGNKMAYHLATCGQKSAYSSLEKAQENTVKRNMLDMLGLVRRDGEQGPEGDTGDMQSDQSATQLATSVDEGIAEADASLAADVGQSEQAPIQFGEMEAAPVVEQLPADDIAVEAQQQATYITSPDQSAGPVVVQQPLVMDAGVIQQPQYTISFGQPEVPQHTLTATDIDMPLIGELADPNTPATPQFLGEVHTPMFDAVAAAEQQHHYYQQQQQLHHQHPQQ